VGVSRTVAQPHLAHLTGGSSLPSSSVIITRAGLGPADRAAVRQPLGAGDDGGGLALGAGVELEDPLGAQPVDPHLLQPLGARLGEVPHHLAG
jgi:hypothetical protein